jgi:hypothetical protein
MFFERLMYGRTGCEQAPTSSEVFFGYFVVAAVRWRKSKRFKNRKNLNRQKCVNLADCPSGVFV